MLERDPKPGERVRCIGVPKTRCDLRSGQEYEVRRVHPPVIGWNKHPLLELVEVGGHWAYGWFVEITKPSVLDLIPPPFDPTTALGYGHHDNHRPPHRNPVEVVTLSETSLAKLKAYDHHAFDEAAGAIPCGGCSGYRAPGLKCNFCGFPDEDQPSTDECTAALEDDPMEPHSHPFPAGVAEASSPSDQVFRPSYYARFVIDPVTFAGANKLPFNIANVVKYVCRYDAKNGREDLLKARRYIDIQLECMDREDRVTAGENPQDVWKETL